MTSSRRPRPAPTGPLQRRGILLTCPMSENLFGLNNTLTFSVQVSIPVVFRLLENFSVIEKCAVIDEVLYMMECAN